MEGVGNGECIVVGKGYFDWCVVVHLSHEMSAVGLGLHGDG